MLALVVSALAALVRVEGDGNEQGFAVFGKAGEHLAAHESAGVFREDGLVVILEGVHDRAARLMVGEEHANIPDMFQRARGRFVP
jgi:hypothetical protein